MAGFTWVDCTGGGDYTVVPRLDRHPLNGVSTYDILLIDRHLLNLRSLQGPEELVAADVNRSGTITISASTSITRTIGSFCRSSPLPVVTYKLPPWRMGIRKGYGSQIVTSKSIFGRASTVYSANGLKIQRH